MGIKSGSYRFYIDGDRCVQKQGNRLVVVGRVLKKKTKTVAPGRKTVLASADARIRAFNFTNSLLSDTP